VFQPHLVQDAGRGADVLANTGIRLICAQFTVHVAGTRVPLELDLVRMPLRGPILDSGDLGGIPGESVRIERRREGDPLSFMVRVVDHLVLATDAPPIPTSLLVIAILAQDVGSRIFEITIDQMVRQAARVVGCELHDAFRVPGRAGRVHRTGGAGQPRAQRGRGDQTGDESCEESHSFFIPSYCF